MVCTTISGIAVIHGEAAEAAAGERALQGVQQILTEIGQGHRSFVMMRLGEGPVDVCQDR